MIDDFLLDYDTAVDNEYSFLDYRYFTTRSREVLQFFCTNESGMWYFVKLDYHSPGFVFLHDEMQYVVVYLLIAIDY